MFQPLFLVVVWNFSLILCAKRGQGIEAYIRMREFRILENEEVLLDKECVSRICLVLGMWSSSPHLSYYLILYLIFACTRGLAASHYSIAFICFPFNLCLTSCSPLEYEITLLIGVWGWGLVGWRRGRKGCWTWPEHQQWQQMVTNVLSDCH